jgi:hypothetical protein
VLCCVVLCCAVLCRLLQHPLTKRPLLLGPAVDAKLSRLGSTGSGEQFGRVWSTQLACPPATPVCDLRPPLLMLRRTGAPAPQLFGQDLQLT